jgi:hypothetical protein
MILALKTLTKLTSTTSSKNLHKTTKLKKTGKELGISASHSIGTTRNTKATFPCPVVSNEHSSNLDILSPNNVNIKQPHKHTVPTYGATIQYTKDDDATNLISKEEKKYIQQVLGTFLYNGRTVDSTMLMALSSIASTQAEPTKETMENIKLFLNYSARHQDAILTYPT